MRRAVRVTIEGRVQGVGYRAWVAATAAELDLDGWVANRTDGRVEAVLAGPPDRVEDMLVRCRKGPAAARVDRVSSHDEPGSVAPGFAVEPAPR